MVWRFESSSGHQFFIVDCNGKQRWQVKKPAQAGFFTPMRSAAGKCNMPPGYYRDCRRNGQLHQHRQLHRHPTVSRTSAVIPPAAHACRHQSPAAPPTSAPCPPTPTAWLLSTPGHPGRDRTEMSWCNAGSPCDDNTRTGRLRSASPPGCRPEPMSECGGLRSLPPPFPSRLSSAPRCTPCKSDPSHCRHPC